MAGREDNAMEIEDVQGETVHPLKEKLDAADEVAEAHPSRALQIYREIVEDADSTEQAQRVKEHAIYKQAQIYAKEGQGDKLKKMLHEIRPYFSTIAKAKTGKIVRTVIDIVAKIPNSRELQIDLCLDSIEWCNTEKHTFLRQRIEGKLASLYFDVKKYSPALDLVNKLIREIKRLDDKQLLVETHLVESKIHHALRNIPKAKAALTASRTAANAIYVTPRVQAHIDKMSGTLHSEEKDYKTAFSYFLEAFEAFSQLDDAEAPTCLKYMLLCRVMSGDSSEVNTIINGKAGLKYSGRELEALKAVADASVKRSLEEFEAATKKYSKELVQDDLIGRHLTELYEQLLEANLVKIIEPFSCVEIQHVADLIKLPLIRIEAKLSQMILDKKFHGILEQGRGQLIIYDEPPRSKIYTSGLEVLTNVGKVTDSLFRKTELLQH